MSSRPAASLDEPEVDERRRTLDRWVVGVADPILTGIARHWLLLLNLLVLLFIGGAVAAPILLASGLDAPAGALYDTYRAICHQWAFRSFFLLGPRPIYSRDDLDALGFDPFGFVGSPELGWKMAFCERDLAIFAGLLLFGLVYAARWRRAALRPASYLGYAVLIAPMALDGATQLVGWRESTWELRLVTGALFGLASGWLLYPRFQGSFARSLSG